MEADDRYIDLSEEAPGAAPGLPASLLLKFLPLLTELYDMIKQGHGEVSEFHVGGGAAEVIVGPIPVRHANG